MSRTRRYSYDVPPPLVDNTEEHDFGPNKPPTVYQTKSGKATYTKPISATLLSAHIQSDGTNNRIVLEFDHRLTIQDLDSIKQIIKEHT